MTYARSAKLSCRLVENPRARHDDARQAHLVQNNCLLLQLTLGRLRCVQFYADLHCGSSWHREMHMEHTASYHRNTKLSSGQSRETTRLFFDENRTAMLLRVSCILHCERRTNVNSTTFIYISVCTSN